MSRNRAGVNREIWVKGYEVSAMGEKYILET